MLERMIVALLTGMSVWLFEKNHWSGRSAKERIAYGSLIAVLLYLMADYVFQLHLPEMNAIVNMLFLGPARQIVKTISGG